MPGTSVVTCRVYGQEHSGQFAETNLRWSGPDEVVTRIGVPTRLRPGTPVTIEGLALAPGTVPIRLTWDADEIDCEWHAVPQTETTDDGTAAMFRPSASHERSWDATFRARRDTIEHPHGVYPKVRLERMPLAPWFATVATAVSIGASALAIGGIVAIAGLGATWVIPLVILMALIAAATNPLALRMLDAHAELPLPREPEPIGTLVLPGISVEPLVPRSAILDDPVVLEYRRRVLEQTTRLHMLGLSVPISIESGYVPICVQIRRASRSIRSAPFESYTEVDRLIRADLRLKGLFEGETLPPDQTWRQQRHLTVVGEVGAGKTTMLRRLSYMLAEGPLLWIESVPVFIELHRFARRKDLGKKPLDGIRTAIVDQMVDVLARESDNDEAAEFARVDVERVVDALIESGELTLLLDGLDEVSAPASEKEATIERVIGAIAAASEHWNGVRVVVSCRQAEIDRYRRLPDRFVVGEIVPFDESAIETFVQGYFADAPERIARLLDELERSPRVRGLASTPLFLALITLIFEQRGSLPQRRTEIYRRCADLLLREWDAARGRDRQSRVVLEHKEEFLRQLAWELHSAGQRFMKRDDVLTLLRAFMPSVGLAEDEAELLLDEIVAHHGLLRHYDDDWFGFVHFALQEFYTAACIEYRAPLQAAIDQRHRSWWQEILRLYAGRGDCTGVIVRLLNEREDHFHTNLRLAAECLVEQTAVTPALRTKLLAQLTDIAKSTDVPELTRRFWQTLIRAGGPDVAEEGWQAVSNRDLAIDVRTHIVREMSRWAAESYVATALDKLNDNNLSIEVRLELIRLIGTSGDRDAYDKLLYVATDTDKDETLRAAAIERLTMPGQEDMIPAFGELLFDRRTPAEVRRAVARGLRLMKRFEVMARVLEILNDWHVDVALRSSLATVAGELVSADALSALVETVANPRIPPAVRTALAISLKGRDLQMSGEALLDLVRDRQTDYSVRLAIADILSSIATPTYRASLTSLNAERGLEEPIRLRIAIALGAIGDTSTMRALMTILGDSSARPYLRLEAARVLGSFEDPQVGQQMLKVIDSRAMDPFGQELAVLVLDLRSDPELAGPLVDRLTDRSLPLSARLRMANTLSALDARPLVGRIVSMLPDRNFSAQLRGRLALALTNLTDARDEYMLDRLEEILQRTKDVPEILTLAWYLSEQAGQAVYPAALNEEPISYDWISTFSDGGTGGLEDSLPKTGSRRS